MTAPRPVLWRCAGRELRLGPPPGALPLLMGIVNATPDSFSDGGHYAAPDAAVAHALRLVEDGADIIDIGGESTRPGAEPVSAPTELERVLPVVSELCRRSPVLVSVDTSKAVVARACLEAGAQIINDVTALRGDPDLADLVQSHDCGLVLMHMRGTPKTMQRDPVYGDVVREVRDFLDERLRWIEQRGVPRERVAIDPGIGFGKTHSHNLSLIRRLAELADLGRPLALGVSRKGLIGTLLGKRAVHDRLHGTVAAALAGYLRGAHILRVHDVRAVRDALVVARAVETAHDPA
jgi:dihydropteroate synthase